MHPQAHAPLSAGLMSVPRGQAGPMAGQRGHRGPHAWEPGVLGHERALATGPCFLSVSQARGAAAAFQTETGGREALRISFKEQGVEACLGHVWGTSAPSGQGNGAACCSRAGPCCSPAWLKSGEMQCYRVSRELHLLAATQEKAAASLRAPWGLHREQRPSSRGTDGEVPKPPFAVPPSWETSPSLSLRSGCVTLVRPMVPLLAAAVPGDADTWAVLHSSIEPRKAQRGAKQPHLASLPKPDAHTTAAHEGRGREHHAAATPS